MRTLLLVALWILPMAGLADSPQVVGTVRDMYPHLSPDGTQIVFQSNRSGSNQLWLMQADGSGLRQLTEFGGNGAETPQWSPNGRQIVFAAYVAEGNNEVFVMNADGSGQQRLTEGPGYDGHPHWTHDGQHIIFNSDRHTQDHQAPWGERHHDIWRMTANGSAPQRLTDCQGVCTYGSLSPDGTLLLYRHSFTEPALDWALENTVRNSEVVTLDLASGTESRLAPHPAFDGWPRFSPDGRWVVFASNRTGPPRSSQLWRVRQDGSGLEALTHGNWGHAQPAWSFDGSQMLSYRFQEYPEAEYGGVVVLPLDP